MGIYIKNLEMPDCCAYCPMCNDYDSDELAPNHYWCSALDEAPDIYDIFGNRPDFCPLEEIDDGNN